MSRKDYRSRGTPTKPKVIERPTFNELDIGMSDPDKQYRTTFQKAR